MGRRRRWPEFVILSVRQQARIPDAMGHGPIAPTTPALRKRPPREELQRETPQILVYACVLHSKSAGLALGLSMERRTLSQSKQRRSRTRGGYLAGNLETLLLLRFATHMLVPSKTI